MRSHMTEDGIQIETQRVKIMNKICIATEDMGQALKCLVTAWTERDLKIFVSLGTNTTSSVYLLLK